MKVPGFLLRRLYVKGSLRATETGFSFELHNSLGSGSVHEMRPLTLDRMPQNPDRTTIRRADGSEVAFSAISEKAPFALEMGRSLTVHVEGTKLTPGKHEIGFSFVVPVVGTLGFTVDDVTRAA